MKPILKKWLAPLLSLKSNRGLKERSWLDVAGTLAVQKWLIGIGTALILSFLLSPSLAPPAREYRVRDIATKEVKASQDLLVEDERATQERRVEAERAVLSVYDFDPAVLSDAETRIRTAFETLAASSLNGKGNDQAARKRAEMESILRPPLTIREWGLLEKEHFNPALAEAAVGLLEPVLQKGIVSEKDLLDPDSIKGVAIWNIQTRSERTDILPFNFLDLKEARSKLRSQADLLSTSLGKETASVILKMAETFLRPNLTFNRNETEGRKIQARERVTPVYFQIKRGEVIVRAGERVQENHLVKIQALRKAQKRHSFPLLFIGLGLLSFLILASLYHFSSSHIRKFALSRKDLVFFSSALVGMIGLFKLFLAVTDILGGEFLSIPASAYIYLFPMAAGVMLVRIVLNSETAIVYAVLLSYFLASLIGNQLSFFLFALTGSMIGAHRVARCEQRSIILKAGLVTGGVNLLAILAIDFVSGQTLGLSLTADLAMGFFGGALSSIFVLGVGPIIESVFGYTTDIKLLELANMDHPLIKELILQAPGTYHHSIIVGSLVEAGAKSVSANPLLSRVSAYYHDIGKLKKPLYFIENTGGAENRHNHLSPAMSSLILLSHVKDGIEFAQEHHLGERITHIIQQHHGTSLISFFYQKAKEQENPDMASVDERDFRYPGPKPQTKEAGIVMLADAVEAASRTLSEPTPSRVRSLVKRITNNIFLDGQLEECELTLKDLHNIEESFTRILNAIFHQRIDYPVAPLTDATRKPGHDNLDSKPAKTVPIQLRKVKKGGQDNPGRTGPV